MSNEQNIYTEDTTLVEIKEGSIGTISVTSNNHNDLDGRNISDQHEIKAITGLQKTLSDIQNPTIAKSVNGVGYAEYHMWQNPKYHGSVGRFVVLVDGSDQIEVINESNKNIFGVTVSQNAVAFIGRDKWEPIIDEESEVVTGYKNVLEDTHDLVCLVGNAKVRYITNAQTLDIQPGDYVKPNIEALPENDEGSNVVGYAIKADSNADSCYRVIRVGSDDDGYYVEINLSLSATDVKKISVDHAKNADNYTNDGAIKTKFDDITNRIDQEVSYIEAGTTIAGKAKNYDETEGTIKARFEDVDSQIEDIVDGTTIVAHSNVVNYVNVEDIESETVQAYGIKFCTTEGLDDVSLQMSNAICLVTDDTTIEDMVAWKTNITTGDEVVFMSTCALSDGAGNNIQDNYYFLGARNEREIEPDGHVVLQKYTEPGVYEINATNYNDLYLPSGIPLDPSTNQPLSGYIKLIVEVTGQTEGTVAFRQTLQGGSATFVRTGVKTVNSQGDVVSIMDTDDWLQVVTSDMLSETNSNCIQICDTIPSDFNCPIGTILTCCTDTSQPHIDAQFTTLYVDSTYYAGSVEYPTSLSVTKPNNNSVRVPGTWRARGLCGQDNDEKWYVLVQRVE